MIEWKDVTDTFSEERRHYNGKYLEQDEVYGDELEVSIFSALEEEWEIYFSFGIFYGIVYAKGHRSGSQRCWPSGHYRRAQRHLPGSGPAPARRSDRPAGPGCWPC